MPRVMELLGRIGLLVLVIALLSGTSAAKEEFVVGIASWSDEAEDFYINVMVPAFEAMHPDLEVTLQQVGWSADQIKVRYASGVAPDVIQFGSDKFGSYQSMLEPLDTYMEKRPVDNPDDFPAPTLMASIKDGRLYAFPWHVTIRTLVYNKEMFRQAGIDEARGPDNWDEVRDYARKTTARTTDGTWQTEGLNISSHWLEFSPWVFQAGGRYIKSDERTSGLDEPGVRRAIEFALELVHELEVAAPNTVELEFSEGQAAMSIEGVEALFGGGKVAAEDVGVSHPPRDAVRTTLIAPAVWAVVNRSQYKEAAWDWIRLASTAENLADMAQRNLALPPRLSLLDVPPMSVDPRIQTFLSISGIATSFNGGAPGFEEAMHQVVGPTLTGIVFEGEPISVLPQAAERMERLILEEAELASGGP